MLLKHNTTQHNIYWFLAAKCWISTKTYMQATYKQTIEHTDYIKSATGCSMHTE